MSLPDIKKFSIGEMFSGANGKTACALVCAFLLIITGCGTFIYGCIQKNLEIIINASAFSALGTGLLGIRRFTPDKIIKPEDEPNP